MPSQLRKFLFFKMFQILGKSTNQKDQNFSVKKN
jgi:hypothetical protein